MLVCDYIVDFLVKKKITDVFGYPGGMVTYLMNSFDKHSDKIKAHVCYHEQGAAFAACAYGQVSGLPGIAYATSGPGATNLLTGIANAYFDSIPCIFITGQVNTYESKGDLKVRQKGFQETDIVSMAKTVTKYAAQITDANLIRTELEKALSISVSGRPGPVLLDVPMNIQRTDIDPLTLKSYVDNSENNEDISEIVKQILIGLSNSHKPIIIAGAGVTASGVRKNLRTLINQLHIPTVTSMVGVDVLSSNDKFNYGFIGAYGHRWANFITAKCDFMLILGSRMDCRQTGSNKTTFAPNAKVVRVDVDENEMTNKVKVNEVEFTCNLKELLPSLVNESKNMSCVNEMWLKECSTFYNELSNLDIRPENEKIKEISEFVPNDVVVTTDVGQNQVWIAQSFKIKDEQRVIFSGGHGAMGYSLPAAIGAYYATHKPVYCFTGDGGLQMNIQELQFLKRENIPVKIILMNNSSLGMIRHFQEMYFDSNYAQTTDTKGYTVPDFYKIAVAYGIKAYKLENVTELNNMFSQDGPAFIEVICNKKTYVYPKLAINKPIHDQDPLIDRKLFEKLDLEEI